MKGDHTIKARKTVTVLASRMKPKVAFKNFDLEED